MKTLNKVIKVLSTVSTEQGYFMSLNKKREYAVIWRVYKGMADCSIEEDNMFFYVTIYKLFSDVIVDEYKIAKILS